MQTSLVSEGVGARRRSNGSGGAQVRAAQQNVLSCTYCRGKKIRCNRQDPCSNCVKVRVKCIFPRPVRIGRKRKDTASAELSARVRQLEETIFRLNENIERKIDTMPLPAVSSSPPALESTADTSDTENRAELVHSPSRKTQFVGSLVPDHSNTVTEECNHGYRDACDLTTKEEVRIVLVTWCQFYSTLFRASLFMLVPAMKCMLTCK